MRRAVSNVGCLLMLLAFADPVLAQSLRVTAATTNLRVQPAAESDIRATLTQGAELEVLGQDGAWYRVRVRSSGVEGFVHSLVVETIAPGAPAATSAPPASAPTPPSARPPAPAAPRIASPATPQPVPSNAPTERNYFIRPLGGLWSDAGSTGFALGGGVAARPFSNEHVEVSGDFLYARQDLTEATVGDLYDFADFSLRSRLFQGSANALYNIELSNQTFTPFAGLGIAYGDRAIVGSARDPFLFDEIEASVGLSGISLQGLVGFEKSLNDRRALRVELRGTSHGLFLLGGLSF